MAADSLKRIGDKICQDYLGFNPTSNSTKPPHIANGLFRACIGETCDTRDVHEWVISDGRKDALPSEKIVAAYACILEKGECEYSCRMRNPERQGLKDLKRLEMA